MENESVAKKPILRKLTPEEIKIKRVDMEEKELEVRDLEITNTLLQKDIDELIVIKKQRLRMRRQQNKIEEIKYDIKIIKRLLRESQ